MKIILGCILTVLLKWINITLYGVFCDFKNFVRGRKLKQFDNTLHHKSPECKQTIKV